MSGEARVMSASVRPVTREVLEQDLRNIGLVPGQTVLVHSSLSRIGWVPGGPVTVIEALLSVIGAEGTLVMPSHSADNSEPSHWRNPPARREWWPIIRAEWPPFDPDKTPTRSMGRIAEAFRSWPGSVRSYHPTVSFSAFGTEAGRVVARHELADWFGEASPVAALYELDAHVLLLGVGHDSNSSLHLAEARARYPGKKFIADGSAILTGGRREWREYTHIDWGGDDFAELGSDFEAHAGVVVQPVGRAPSRFMRQRLVVDYAVTWMESKRGPSLR